MAVTFVAFLIPSSVATVDGDPINAHRFDRDTGTEHIMEAGSITHTTPHLTPAVTRPISFDYRQTGTENMQALTGNDLASFAMRPGQDQRGTVSLTSSYVLGGLAVAALVWLIAVETTTQQSLPR